VPFAALPIGAVHGVRGKRRGSGWGGGDTATKTAASSGCELTTRRTEKLVISSSLAATCFSRRFVPQADLVADKIAGIVAERVEIGVPRHELRQCNGRVCQSHCVAAVICLPRIRVASGWRAETVADRGIEVPTVHVPAVVDDEIVRADAQVL
jgi:hypothetical protein